VEENLVAFFEGLDDLGFYFGFFTKSLETGSEEFGGQNLRNLSVTKWLVFYITYVLQNDMKEQINDTEFIRKLFSGTEHQL